MNRTSTLAERREHLVEQAAAQRIALAKSMEPWRAPLALGDRGVAAFRYVRRHPALWLAAVLVIAVWRPKLTRRWPGRAWLAWRLGRRWFRN